jgi:hypothetical protein
MNQARKALKSKRSLGESSLMSYLTTLVRTSSGSDTVSGSDRGEQTSVAPTSESDISSDESAGSSIARRATWGKIDKTPALGEFTGNPGVTQIPVDPT